MAKKMTWQEPSAYKKAVQKHHGTGPDYKKSLAFTAVFAGVILVVAIVRGHAINDSWPITVLACLSFIPIIGWFVPWVTQQMGDKIVVSAKGITRSVAQGANIQMRTTKWPNVTSAEWGSVTVSGETFETILIRCDDNSSEAIVLSKKLIRERLRELVESNGAQFLTNN